MNTYPNSSSNRQTGRERERRGKTEEATAAAAAAQYCLLHCSKNLHSKPSNLRHHRLHYRTQQTPVQSQTGAVCVYVCGVEL